MHIVGTGEVETKSVYETIYEEVEVPVYIYEVEVPTEPGA